MFVFQMAQTGQPSKANTPVRGAITENNKVTAFIKSNPLTARFLAIKDWGESPWKIQHIVSEAVLCLERASTDSEKKGIAKKIMADIESRVNTAKTLYNKLLTENGGENDVTSKLKDDISFMENMRNVIDAQVNGLVSRQKSWRKRAEDIQNRYDEQLKLKSWWENVKAKVPWLTAGIGIGTAAVVGWALNGWDALIQLTQYAFKAGHSSKLVLDYIKPVVDIAFGVASAAGFGWLAYRIAKSKVLQSLYEKHLRGTLEAVKKHASWTGAAMGVAAGFMVFATGQLDGAINFARETWKAAHSDPNMVQFIDPLARLFVNAGGMAFFGWFLHKMDKKSFASKQRLLDECEKKQKEIMDEEKVFRRKIIAIIKEKAIELHAKYGYCVELDREDVKIMKLAEEGNFDEINAIHKIRMQKIFADEAIPDEQLVGAEADSRSTDLVVRVPMDSKA